MKRGARGMREFRCEKCKKLLGKYTKCKQLEIKCPRCDHMNNLINQKKVAVS